jgi:hypothetical protein
MSLWLRQSRKGAGGRGEDPLYSDLLDPARLNLAAVEVQQGRLLAPEISTRTSHDVIRPPTGSATHRLAGAIYIDPSGRHRWLSTEQPLAYRSALRARGQELH